MKSNNLRQIGENVKSQHKYLEGLSPEERRAAVIKMCHAQSKTSKKNSIPLLIMGVIFLAITFYIWYVVYKMDTSSTLGLAGGLILATIGFKFVSANRIKSYNKILSGQFTNDDVTAYFQEHEQINQRFLERWNKGGKYICFIGIGIMLFLINKPSTATFTFVSLIFGISVFFIGIVIMLSPFRVKKNQKNTKIIKMSRRL